MNRFLASIFALLLTAIVAIAGDYVYDAGTGWYYNGGAAYIRTDNGAYYRARYPNYDNCNRLYYTYGPWVWEPSYSYTPVKVPVAAGFDEARATLFRIKEGQARVENRIRERAAETMLLDQTAGALGLRGNLYTADLTGNPFGGYQSNQSVFAGYAAGQQNGNTQYGVSTTSYKRVEDSYGTVDLNARYVERNRALLAWIAAGQDADARDAAGVAQLTAGQIAVAEIDAKRRLAVETMAGIKAQPVTRTETTIRGTTNVPVPVPERGPAPDVMPKADAFDRATWLKQPGPAQCVSCHGAGAASQKVFDLTTYQPDDTLSPIRAKVLECTSGQSATCKMPKDGARLPASQQLQLLTGTIIPVAKKE